MMTDMLFRLNPNNAIELLSLGVMDVPALIAYLSPLVGVVVGLFVMGLGRKRPVVAGIMGGILALIIALARIGTGFPPQYMDYSSDALVTPSESIIAQIATYDDPVFVSLSAPQGGTDPLLNAALINLQRTNRFIYTRLETDDDSASNTLTMIRGGAATAIPYDRLIVTNPAVGDEGARSKRLNLENELMQAEALLMSGAPNIYRLAGSEDIMYPTVLVDVMRDLTIEAIRPLNLNQAVPADCTFIVIDNPREDLTTEQAAVLQSYLRRGGRMLLITDYAYGAMPNMNTALEEYGLAAIDGVVLDPGSAMGGWAEYPMPSLTEDHIIGRWLVAAGQMPLMPLSHAIELKQITGTQSWPILTTTEDSYLQLASLQHESLAQDEGDVEGPFTVAAAAEMGNGRIVWIASADMMTQASDMDVGGANSALLLASMRYLMDVQVEPVASRSLN